MDKPTKLIPNNSFLEDVTKFCKEPTKEKLERIECFTKTPKQCEFKVKKINDNEYETDEKLKNGIYANKRTNEIMIVNHDEIITGCDPDIIDGDIIVYCGKELK